MNEVRKRLCAIGLVGVLMVGMLMSFPLGAAKKPPGPPPPPADPAIAFYAEGGRNQPNQLMVMNDDGSNQVAIYEEYFGIYGRPSWSPDGESIAWTGSIWIPNVPGSSEMGIWRIDVEIVDGEPQGSNLLQLVSSDDLGDGCHDAAWSPLGDEIAYMYHLPGDTWKIDAVPATGGTPYNIYTTPEGHALTNGIAWSSDGTEIAAVGGEISAGADGKSILIIDRDTGAVTNTLLTGQYGFKGLDWARQGSDMLVFYEWSTIYTVDIDTETVSQVVEGYRPSWSPDNSKIVYLQAGRKPKIGTYEFGTGEITTLSDYGTRPDWQR